MTLSIVILAAGQGSRMHSDIPKVLHTLGGQSLLAHVIATAMQLEPRQIRVVYGHGGEAVKHALAGAPVEWIEQAEQLGTGHALQHAMSGISDADAVLVLYGDVPLIRSETLSRLANAVEAGLALLTMEPEDASGYGRIVRDSAGSVRGIVEERDASDNERRLREVNTGILMAPAARLRGWLERLDNRNAQGEYYLTDIVAMAADEGVTISALKTGDPLEAQGINDTLQLAIQERHYQNMKTEALMKQGVTLRDPARLDVRGELSVGRDVIIDVNVILEGTVSLGDRVSIGPNVTIKDCTLADDVCVLANCVLEGATIGKGARLGPFARLRPQTDIGEGAHIGNFVEVKMSRVGAGSKINHLSYIGDTEVGRNVNIGAGTITCNYDGASKHKTVIGDGAFIGSNTQLVAPVTIGEGATIGAGSTITADAPAGELTVSRSEQKTLKGWQRPRKGDSN